MLSRNSLIFWEIVWEIAESKIISVIQLSYLYHKSEATAENRERVSLALSKGLTVSWPGTVTLWSLHRSVISVFPVVMLSYATRRLAEASYLTGKYHQPLFIQGKID